MNKLLVLLALLTVCVGGASGVSCYFCSNCPNPFNPYSIYVSKVVSNTGFCAKKSTSSSSYYPATRGPAEYGLCYSRGCRWTTDTSGRSIYTCCCTSNYCNTGSITSKATTAVLLGALMLLGVNRYI